MRHYRRPGGALPRDVVLPEVLAQFRQAMTNSWQWTAVSHQRDDEGHKRSRGAQLVEDGTARSTTVAVSGRRTDSGAMPARIAAITPAASQ